MIDAVERARRLAAAFHERADEYDRAAAFPKADVDDLRAEGLLGLMVPQALGGHGASFEEYTNVAMALAAGNPSTALLFNMHASVTGGLAGITEELARALGLDPGFLRARERALRAAATGAMYGVAITEPEAGSRLSALRTSYRAEDGGYRLQGLKSVCSGAGYLDAYLVAARAAEAPEHEPRISYFLVPHGDGLEVEETWDPLGMRATSSNTLRLDVVVPRDALLGGVEGLVLPLAYSMPQWLVASYAAVYAGVAAALVEEAVSYLRGRVVAGERGGLSNVASVRDRLGRVDAAAEAARLVVEEAARRVDRSPVDPETYRWVYRAKLVAGDTAMAVASGVSEACGLGALRRGQALERLVRDARLGALMPPSSDVCATYLGTAALGLDPASEVRPW